MSDQIETSATVESYPEPFAGGARAMFALFNRQSGAFMLLMGRLGDEEQDRQWIDETHYIVKSVDIDPDKEMIVGNADSFTVEPQAEQRPQINEHIVNASCRDKIQKVWPIHRQVNAMADVLEKMLEKYPLEPGMAEGFLQMREYVAECQERNGLYKAAYQAHPDFDYQDKSAVAGRVNDELSGGLSEVIGGPMRAVDLPHGGSPS